MRRLWIDLDKAEECGAAKETDSDAQYVEVWLNSPYSSDGRHEAVIGEIEVIDPEHEVEVTLELEENRVVNVPYTLETTSIRKLVEGEFNSTNEELFGSAKHLRDLAQELQDLANHCVTEADRWKKCYKQCTGEPYTEEEWW